MVIWNIVGGDPTYRTIECLLACYNTDRYATLLHSKTSSTGFAKLEQRIWRKTSTINLDMSGI
jgi:hypothetical protein